MITDMNDLYTGLPTGPIPRLKHPKWFVTGFLIGVTIAIIALEMLTR